MPSVRTPFAGELTDRSVRPRFPSVFTRTISIIYHRGGCTFTESPPECHVGASGGQIPYVVMHIPHGPAPSLKPWAVRCTDLSRELEQEKPSRATRTNACLSLSVLP